MLHHASKIQVHEVVPTYLVQVAVRQSAQSAWLRLTVLGTLVVFVTFH